MGGIISKIMGSKVTLRERLDKVDKELRNIQRFQFDTELSQKRWIGRLMIASSVLYFIAAGSFYFFGPRGATWKTTVLYLIPFIVFPFLIWGVRRVMAWHYKRKIGNNVDKHKELKTERQRLLEDVMEFETFNNAKEILEKYDPNRLLPKYLAERVNTPASSPSATPVSTGVRGADFQDTLRRRNLGFGQLVRTPGLPVAQTPQMRPMPGVQGQFLRQAVNMPFPLPRPAIMPSGMTPPPRPQFIPQGPRPMYMMPQAPGNPTLHNRNTGWLDKLVDYVVGDGPANRYALICKYCATHNGLATPEDFPFTGYRCVFCRQYNPPRQVKPAAEKLPVNVVGEVDIEEMDSDRSEIQSPGSVVSSVASPRRDEEVELSLPDAGIVEEQGTTQRQDNESSPPVTEDANNEFDHVDEGNVLETEVESVNQQPGQSQSGFGSGVEESELLPADLDVNTKGGGTESAESVSSGDNDPFEFVELTTSEVKMGDTNRQMAETLSEASADLPPENPL